MTISPADAIACYERILVRVTRELENDNCDALMSTARGHALVEYYRSGYDLGVAAARSSGPPLIYLASPYTHEDPWVMGKRAEAATKAFARLLCDGLCAYSPIASCHAAAVEHGLDTGWAFWKAYDQRLIDACDSVMVLTLPGWRESVGVAAEIEYARAKGKPVAFLDPETWEVTE